MKNASKKSKCKGSGNGLRAQTLPPAVAADLATLRELIRHGNGRQWEIADCLMRLIGHGLKLADIANELGYRKGSLSMLASVGKAFPAEKRRTDLPFHAHRLADYAMKRVERNERRAHGNCPSMDAGTILTTLAAEKVRDMRAAVRTVQATVRKARQKDKAKRKFPSDGEFINRCHHGDCANFAHELAPKSAQILHLDPPYAQYRKHNDGRHDMAVRDIYKMTECDNNTADTAIAATVGAIESYAPALADNGALLLWQASTTPLRLPILEAIEASGLEVDIMVVWDKSVPQPRDPSTAWTPQCEIMYVLKRPNALLGNHNGEHRGNVVRMGRDTEAGHVFQKPMELCEMLIRKHSDPKDLIVDCFGCSGVFCIAAHRLKRRWVYMESNKENYDWGAARVYAATDAQ